MSSTALCSVYAPRGICIKRRLPQHCRAGVAQDITGTALPSLLPLDDTYKDRHAFSAYANWLVPGYLMAGRYPFIEPNRCRTREQGEDQLEAIMSTGVSTFVSLQSELPPQEKMSLTGVDGFYPYKSTADLIAASLSDHPPSEVVEGLRNPFVDKFVPPRRRDASEAYKNYKPIQPQCVHYPVADLSVTTQDHMEQIVHDLSSRLQQGEKMMLHCWGGRGRAGMVGACLLATAYGISADEALQRVQLAFETRNDTETRSPQTDEQIQFVKDFCA